MNNVMELHKILDTVKTKSDLVGFLHAVVGDYENNIHQWENTNLLAFLQAMAAWSESMEHSYQNMGEEFPAEPSWNTLARIIYAAKFYE